MNNKSMIKKRVWKIVMIFFWILLLAVLARLFYINRKVLSAYLFQADYHYLIWVLIGYLASLCGATITWSYSIRSLDTTLSWWQHVRIFLLTFAYRRLPGTIWYVGGRLAMYQQLGIPRVTVMLASTVETIITVASGLLVGLVFTAISGIENPYGMALLIITVIALAIVIMLPWLTKLILRILKKDAVQNLDRFYLSLGFIGMIFCWLSGGMMVGLMVAAFNPLSLKDFASIVGMWGIAGTAGYLVLVLPSSFGLTEVTMALLLSRLIPLSLAGVIVIFIRVLTTSMEIAFALLTTVFSKYWPGKGEAVGKT